MRERAATPLMPRYATPCARVDAAAADARRARLPRYDTIP